MKDSRSTSAVWKYFTCLSSELAQCCLCFRNYSRKGRGTTSLKSHLRSMHKEQYRDLLDLEDKKMKWKEEMARKASLAPLTSSSSIKSTVDIETPRLPRNDKESSEVQESLVLPSSSPSSSSSLSSTPPPTTSALIKQEPPPSSFELKVEAWEEGIFLYNVTLHHLHLSTVYTAYRFTASSSS